MRRKKMLKAGAGEADITPALGIQIAGDIGRYRPVEEIRDPLFARALVIESGGKKVCWLSLDILAISRAWADEIRNRAAARFGFDAAHVMVHVVQNHAAPAVGHFFVFDKDELGLFPKEHPWLLGGDDRYNPVCVGGALQAVARAVENLQPAAVAVGRGMDGRVAFNRRFIMRDGTVRTHPALCSPDILCCEGPMDPEVGVIQFIGAGGRPLAVVLHHTCHPVHGYPQRWVSAGWPGAWCNGVRALCGADCVPLVLNGFCGNIHHMNHLDPVYKDDYQEMGRKLTETTAGILKRLEPVADPVLGVSTQSMRIPMRSPTPREVREACQLLKQYPQPKWTDAAHTAVEWDWVYAASRLDLAWQVRRHPLFDYPVQVFRLGNIAIVAVPGEPFVEEQLRIKQHSPAAFTFTAHMSNSYVGYIPTLAAFKRGGYETRTGAGSKLDPAALSRIGDRVLKVLNRMFKKPA